MKPPKQIAVDDIFEADDQWLARISNEPLIEAFK